MNQTDLDLPLTTSLALAAADLTLALPVALPESSSCLEPLRDVAGQDRAREALRFGLAIRGDGYNVAVSGPTSSGRSTIARIHVEEAAAQRPSAPDWCYLYNFEDPRRPRAVSLPIGSSAALLAAVDELIRVCKEDLPRAFDSEGYAAKVQQTLEPFTREREAAIEKLAQSASEVGLVLNPTPLGLVPVPRAGDGSPMSQTEFNALTTEARMQLERAATAIADAISATDRHARHIEVQARAAVEAVDREITRFVVGPVLDDLREEFDGEELEHHFTAIQSDIVANLAIFKRFTEGFGETAPPAVVGELTAIREQLLRRYKVNVFVRNDPARKAAPVREERNPSVANMFGRMEFENQMGVMVTDFLHLRAGSLHLANGGFLILQLQDVLSEPRVWPMLKLALKNREVRVGEFGQSILPFPVVDLVPEGIPLDVKLVLIGQPHVFAILSILDEEFASLFKIRAEFEPDVELTADSIDAFARFVRKTQCDLGLKDFEAGGIEELLRHGSRLAERKDRLTTRYGVIADLCVEADHLATAATSRSVDAVHVRAASNGRAKRSGLVADRIRRLTAEGTLRVETSGSVVGQVNGLAVYQVGDYFFGTPARITCRVGPGRRGVVAIERETERSGAMHTKGVLVLSGFLTGMFGKTLPLAFNASLTFEQSYDEVEGDSASSAELYAILTALAELPVNQSIAVTGSIDQFGNVQAVGGVNEKIEGFFDLCAATGLTGGQGVVIPASNVRNLTVRADVIAAVEESRFHVWAVSRVEQGIELLTGLRAGERDSQGLFPSGSVFARVQRALESMHASAVTTLQE